MNPNALYDARTNESYERPDEFYEFDEFSL